MIFLVAFYLLACIIYLTSFGMYVRRGTVGLGMGVNLGVMYLVLLPMSILMITGGIAAPDSGSARSYAIPVSLEGNFRELAIFQSMIILYGLCDLCSHAFRQQFEQKHLSRAISHSLPNPYLLIAIYLIYATVLFVAMGLASGGHWAESRSEFFQEYGVIGNTAVLLGVSLRMIVLCVLVVTQIQGKIAFSRMLIAMGLICIVDLYTTGNRIFTLQALMVVALLLLFMKRWKTILTMAAAMIPFGFIMVLWGGIRSQMHRFTSEGFSGVVRGFIEGWNVAQNEFRHGLRGGDFVLGITEGVSLNHAVKIIQVFPQQQDYLYGSTLIKVLVFWVPRSLWPNKPNSMPVIVGELIRPGQGISMNCTIFGEFYANFGIFGVLLIPMLLVLVAKFFYRSISQSQVAAWMLFIGGFTLVRMSFADTILTLIFCAILFFLFTLLGSLFARQPTISTPVDSPL